MAMSWDEAANAISKADCGRGMSKQSFHLLAKIRELDALVRSGGARTLTEALRALDVEGVTIGDVGLRRPTLDDVFLSLTGHISIEESASAGEEGGTT